MAQRINLRIYGLLLFLHVLYAVIHSEEYQIINDWSKGTMRLSEHLKSTADFKLRPYPREM